jgi:predicted ATPase
LLQQLGPAYADVLSCRAMSPATTQATVDWSYDLLDDREISTFRRLGVFSGGCDLAAVERVCHDIDPLDVLHLVDRLVDKSRIVADQRALPAARDDAPVRARPARAGR